MNGRPAAADSPPSNPFATRFVRPGAIPFVFAPSVDAAALVGRLAQCGWRGAIVGRHGSGKSTLAASLVPELERAGRRVIWFALHDGQRSLPRGALPARLLDAQSLVIVDGYEQLSRWSRWRLSRDCRRFGAGLLVTSHDPTRLPELYRTVADMALFERIVSQLIGDRRYAISREEREAAFESHHGNVREALFSLYDLVEQRLAESRALRACISNRL